MPSVLYTPDIFSLQRVGGISRYFCELIPRISNQGTSVKVPAGIHFNRHLKRLPIAAGIYIPKLGPLGNYRLGLNQAFFRRTATQHSKAIIHSTYYSAASYPKSHPIVLTVYDMIDEIFPDRATAVPPGLKRHHCEKADHLIAISAVTKDDLVRIFGIAPEKITVIHLGVSMPAGDVEVRQMQPYLLFVGVRDAYKNFLGFLEAFAASPGLRSSFNVVAFGGGRFSDQEQHYLDRLSLTNKVQFASGDDDLLGSYYRSASALIFPSLYEGFGLPILEAMAQNCPVICSDAASLPEIAGDAAAYFDGRDVGSIRLVMEATLTNENRLSELRRLGTERSKFFSWDKCAQQTADVYLNLENE